MVFLLQPTFAKTIAILKLISALGELFMQGSHVMESMSIGWFQ